MRIISSSIYLVDKLRISEFVTSLNASADVAIADVLNMQLPRDVGPTAFEFTRASG